MNNSVDPGYFPFIRDPVGGTAKASSPTKTGGSAGNLVGVPDSAHPYSLRTTRAKWANKKKEENKENGVVATEDSLVNSVEYRRNGPTVLVFVLGGMTYSEMRSAYEVMNQYKRDVIIGECFPLI